MNLEKASDAKLLVASDKDATAFRALYKRYAERIMGYHLRRCRDEQAALDLTAETFAQVWWSRRAFRDESGGSAGPWLYGIARNVLLQSVRRERLEDGARQRLGLLEEEGVDLDRVVIGHMDTHPDLAYVRAVFDRGVSVAFDTIGKQFWDFRVAPLPDDMPEGAFTKDAYHRADATRADRIAQLVAAGFTGRLLLAQDMTGSEVYLNPDTHGQHGYAYLFDEFATMLRTRGVSDADLDRMLIDNPARLLTLTSD